MLTLASPPPIIGPAVREGAFPVEALAITKWFIAEGVAVKANSIRNEVVVSVIFLRPTELSIVVILLRYKIFY